MSGGNRNAGGGRGLPGAGLITIEIALARVLLTGAGLLLRSFQHLMERRLGFGVEVVTAEAGLTQVAFPGAEQRIGFWHRTLAELGSLPGVSAAGVATWLPLAPAGATFVEISGREVPNAGAGYRVIGGEYFQALDIPLLAGRFLGEEDGAGANRVALINQSMASKFWPGQNPIGRQVRAVSMEPAENGIPSPWLTIVGVVGDVRHWGMESEPTPELYVDYRQVPRWATQMSVIVRGSGRAAPLVPLVQRRLQQLDLGVALVMGTLKQRLDQSLANRRFVMAVLTGFSVLAVMLAAIGLYAVLAYSVSRRTRELAVRTALGATRSQLLRLIFVGVARVVGLGVVLGVAGALLLSRAMMSFLVDISPADPASFLLAVLLLLAIAGFAVSVPALRATRSDPLAALKQE
jgi:putative ABC transport system permease protein